MTNEELVTLCSDTRLLVPCRLLEADRAVKKLGKHFRVHLNMCISVSNKGHHYLKGVFDKKGKQWLTLFLTPDKTSWFDVVRLFTYARVAKGRLKRERWHGKRFQKLCKQTTRYVLRHKWHEGGMFEGMAWRSLRKQNGKTFAAFVGNLERSLTRGPKRNKSRRYS